MNLTASEIKRMLKSWHFYKASTLSLEVGELKRKVDAIEKAINALDDCDAAFIQMRYFKRYEVETIANELHITRQAVYKRLNKILDRIVYCLH